MRAPFSFRTLSFVLALGTCLTAFSGFANAQDATDAAWTTFKGDASRSGSSPAAVSLPLSLQWRFTSAGPARTYSGSPLVIGAAGQQKVIFASGSEVFALDLNTGQQLWKTTNLQTEVVTPLSLLSRADGDYIIGAQLNGKVFALETLKGALKWEADPKSKVAPAGQLIIDTAVGTRIITALNNGTIIALDDAGKIVPDWKITIDRYGSSTIGSLALSPDKTRIYTQTSNQKMICADAPTGRVLWAAGLTSRTSITPIANNDIVISPSSDQILALRTENGSIAWRYKVAGSLQGSPALARTPQGGTLYFGTRAGVFYALDSNTGTVKWQKKFDSPFSGSPLALKSAVLVGTLDGLMMGLAPSTGEQIWQYRLKTERKVETRVVTGAEGAAPDPNATEETIRTFPVSSAPAAVNNWVFVLGDNASLYGFTSNSFDADPPRAVGPTISVPDTAKNLASLELDDTQEVIPGSGPIYFSVELDDIGSGLNTSTIRVLLDDQPLEEKKIDFDAQSGILTLTLVGREKGSLALEEGLKTLNILAEDYAGNKMNYTATFLVDNLASPPPAPVDPAGTPVEGQPPVQNPGGFGGPAPGAFGGPFF